MPVPVTCSACGASTNVSDAARGRSIRCPKCKAPIRVPDPGRQPEPPERVDADEPRAPSSMLGTVSQHGQPRRFEALMWNLVCVAVAVIGFAWLYLLSRADTVLREASVSAAAAVVLIGVYVFARALTQASKSISGR